MHPRRDHEVIAMLFCFVENLDKSCWTGVRRKMEESADVQGSVVHARTTAATVISVGLSTTLKNISEMPSS